MIFLLLFWATSLIVRSANVVNYYHTISTMPTPLLYKKAENFYKHDHADSALICYTIITKRTPVNEEQEKNLRNTWYQLWKIYLEQYNDYVKAKECLLKLQELCEQQKQSLAMCYMMYGVIYDTMAQQVVDDSLRMEAIRSYRKSIQAYRDKQDNPALVYSFTNIVSSLSTLRRFALSRVNISPCRKPKVTRNLLCLIILLFALSLYGSKDKGTIPESHCLLWQDAPACRYQEGKQTLLAICLYRSCATQFSNQAIRFGFSRCQDGGADGHSL